MGKKENQELIEVPKGTLDLLLELEDACRRARTGLEDVNRIVGVLQGEGFTVTDTKTSSAGGGMVRTPALDPKKVQSVPIEKVEEVIFDPDAAANRQTPPPDSQGNPVEFRPLTDEKD